jgi:hypothetical protein
MFMMFLHSYKPREIERGFQPYASGFVPLSIAEFSL